MSGYPDPNYASMPSYPSDAGTSCENPKPSWYWEGGTFCNDVTINGTLTVGTDAILNSLSVTNVSVNVGELTYSPYLFINNYDGHYYYILANQLPKGFVPPIPPI